MHDQGFETQRFLINNIASQLHRLQHGQLFDIEPN